MNIVKINSLAEIDNIIALLLGWVESEIEEECSQFTPGATWIYGGDYYAIKVKLLFPEEVVNAGGESEWTYEHEDWYENGGAPYFSSQWSDTNILLEECDRTGLVLEWFRNKDNIGCQIQKYEFEKPESLIPVVAYTGTNFNIPKSMSLATCMAWLLWHGIKIEFEFDKLTDEYCITGSELSSQDIGSPNDT